MRSHPISLKKNLIAVAIAVTLTGLSTRALAGAFQLFEQNAVGLGNAGAGMAAWADDASTAYFNSAGMIRLKRPEVDASIDDVISNISFNGTNTWASTQPLILPGTFSQGPSAQGAGRASFVPAVHAVLPIPKYRAAFGFSIAAPFGLETEYNPTSIFRYSATRTSVEDIDFSPSLAFAITKHFSLGGGVDYQYLKVNFDGVAGIPIAIPSNPTFFDTSSQNEGDGWGTGWHAALLWQYSDNTRFGLTYRSQTKFNVLGSSIFTGRLAGGLVNLTTTTLTSHDLNADVTLPASWIFGGYQRINSRVAMMGTVVYTQWDVLKQVTLNNVAAIDTTGTIFTNPTFGAPSINQTINAPFFYRNSWRVTAGADINLTDKFLVRFGGGWDQSPVNPTFRDIRLPDADRILVAVGAHYQASENVGLDAGYMHIFAKDSTVNVPVVSGAQISTAVGTGTLAANLVGLQMSVKI